MDANRPAPVDELWAEVEDGTPPDDVLEATGCSADFTVGRRLRKVACELEARHDGPHKGRCPAPACPGPIIWTGQREPTP